MPDLRSPLPIPNGDVETSDSLGNWYALATKNFVLNSLTFSTPCDVATTVNLAATYDNGTSGVGATLTSSGVGVFSVDGLNPEANKTILVKNQSLPLQNGVYELTNAGSVSSSWVLTRLTSYDTPSQITQGGSVSVVNGAVNGVTSWMQVETVTLVGTSAINFVRLARSGIDSVSGQNNEISVSISNNVAYLSFSEDMILPGTGAVTLPGGGTAQRPGSPRPGMLRFNSGL